MQLKMKSTQLGGIANLALVAEVKRGFIPGAEAFTYAERLEALLKTLNAIRLASRESTLSRSPFPDALGRWGILHAFRYALIPPEIGDRAKAAPAGADTLTVGKYRLYLSVTFDGGWEPYIRVIYRDLGSLLDTIFTNCVGYPLSRRCSFDTYTRWVRSREVPAGIFYTESATSVMDERYLTEVERIQREDPDPARARRSIAAFAVEPPPQVDAALAEFKQADPRTQEETLYNSFRALKAIHDLRAYYADNTDGRTLHSFAVAALPEFRAFLNTEQANPKFKAAKAQIDWLLPKADKPKRTSKVRTPVETADGDAQPGILTAFEGVTHGVLFLLAITDVNRAGEYLRSLKLTSGAKGSLAADEVYCNVAFTRQGLEAIRAPVEILNWLPQEFIEGMEARAGMLGDVRGNHPEHWRRPVYQGKEVDLASVHVVLQFRLAAKSPPDELLHPELARIGEHLAQGGAGFRLLSTEPMRSTLDSKLRSIEHFGFKDGFSQPVNSDKRVGAKWDNAVKPGEMLLGYPNDRDDPPYPPKVNPHLDNGSFLVLRKIRQDVGKWRQMLHDAAATLHPALAHRNPDEQAVAIGHVAAKMVGRDMEGNATIDPKVRDGNDFNYEGDPLGMHCPFQSHVRRANPRHLQGKTPRLVRRGMSYGPRFDAKPGEERGLYFMAYCGSIAEQFEVVQRWIAGGNSTGVLAAHSDPMLGVPQKGVERTFQWLSEDGQAARVSLGDDPLTKLEWGLYLFAPSKTALLKLSSPPPRLRAPPVSRVPMKGEAYKPVGKAFEQRKAMLQDREKRDRIWKRVNEAGGEVQTAYGLLVSEPSVALKILQDSTRYSVCGYGRRFNESIGLGFLGLDPEAGHTRLAEDSGIKQRIADISERDAFEAARTVTRELLGTYAPGEAGSGQETFVDILDLNERALAKLCTDWFGFPDESSMHTGTSAEPFTNQATDPPCCPRDFVHVARHIFGPHPSKLERERGIERGQSIHKAVLASVERYLKDEGQLVGLSEKIAVALSEEEPSVIAQTIAGVILGFAPSVHGNFTNVMRAWVEHSTPDTPSLWDLQTRYFDPGRSKDRESYEATVAVLRHDLIKQMRRELIPPAIWREPVGAPNAGGATRETVGATPATEPEKIIVGLHGIMQHESAGEVMMFGGAIKGDPAAPEELKTDHACPGRGMAIGVLLGVISTLLLAGTLRSTPSYTLIKVVR